MHIMRYGKCKDMNNDCIYIYIYIYIYIAYDYRMIIIFREYDIYILNIKYTLIVCLEPSRGIDGHAY